MGFAGFIAVVTACVLCFLCSTLGANEAYDFTKTQSGMRVSKHGSVAGTCRQLYTSEQRCYISAEANGDGMYSAEEKEDFSRCAKALFTAYSETGCPCLQILADRKPLWREHMRFVQCAQKQTV